MTPEDTAKLSKHMNKLKIRRHELQLEIDRIDNELNSFKALQKIEGNKGKLYRGVRI